MIKIEEIAYHRNGISGAGFFVVKFIDPEVSKPKTRLIDKVNQIEGAKQASHGSPRPGNGRG